MALFARMYAEGGRASVAAVRRSVGRASIATVPHVRYSSVMNDESSVKSGILDAAARVLVRDGSDNLTVAAVAREASLSVGGLRYHFASKRELLAGLVEAMVSQFDKALDEAGPEPGARTRAYVEATLVDVRSGQTSAATVGLLAAAAVDTTLLDALRRHYRQWQERLEDDALPAATATAVRLAMGGWWLAVMFDLAPPSGDLILSTKAEILELVERATNA